MFQLLVLYGDTGSKGALIDEHVLGSAKCQVQLPLIICWLEVNRYVIIFISLLCIT